MLISCKCLNFIATSNNQQKQQQSSQSVSQQQLPAATTTAAVATADLKKNNAAVAAAVAMQQSSNDCNNTLLATTSSNNNSITKPSSTTNVGDANNESFSLTNVLRQTFLQKYPRNFIFYSQCVDFFKQAIGPVPDLTINVLSQRDLVYSLTLEIPEAQSSSATRSSWQLSICSNCNVALCAKRLHNNSPPQFLINCGLLTNNEELSQKRSDKAFSDTFGILIMDHTKVDVPATNNQNTNSNLQLSASFVTSSSSTSLHLDSKQLRLRQLQANLQQRLQREIAETDERIQRFTSQQFALLKSFREKSEQEYQMLVALIQCIPEQQANEWLERQPPSLDVSNNGGNLAYATGTRRRNTISSRRELNTTAPTTPTATQPPNTIFNMNRENFMKNSMTATPTSPTSAIMTATNNTTGNNTHSPNGGVNTSTTPTALGSAGSSALNRKMSNFDTPPATPEAIPMSVGNSPTFRQQQHNVFASQQQAVQQQFSTPSVETADDCLFELEGVDGSSIAVTPQQQQQQNRTMYLQNPPSPLRLLQQQQQQQPQNVPHQILPAFNSYQRSLSYINAQPENHMSDLDESDDAEEAEDALDLDTSMPIAMTATPHRRITSKTAAQVANFAKSLPIEIANSPLAVGRSYMATLESDEDELDNNVDIAASIKALAKSVHGEAVFGDLPRPRLRSQI